MYRAYYSAYLRCDARTEYRVALAAGSLSNCFAAALAHGPGATIERWNYDGARTVVRKDNGRVNTIGTWSHE